MQWNFTIVWKYITHTLTDFHSAQSPTPGSHLPSLSVWMSHFYQLSACLAVELQKIIISGGGDYFMQND